MIKYRQSIESLTFVLYSKFSYNLFFTTLVLNLSNKCLSIINIGDSPSNFEYSYWSGSFWIVVWQSMTKQQGHFYEEQHSNIESVGESLVESIGESNYTSKVYPFELWRIPKASCVSSHGAHRLVWAQICRHKELHAWQHLP